MIKVSGDRQTGKTHLLLELAAFEAIAGKSVLFECHDWKVAEDAHRRLLDQHMPQQYVERSWQSNGNRLVTTLNGGSVRFLSGAGNAYRGGRADAHIFDEVEPADRPVPGARVYYAPRTIESDAPYWP